jgi:fructoselysine-6-P-deglycase FrlB-like protein
VLRIAIPKGGGTPEQMAALEAAREYAEARGVKLVIVEE